jgi:hypothetical protein
VRQLVEKKRYICVFCGQTRALVQSAQEIKSKLKLFDRPAALNVNLSAEIVGACEECNTTLGRNTYSSNVRRALYLIETYANKLQYYDVADQLDLVDRFKNTFHAYESFLVAAVDDAQPRASMELQIPDNNAEYKTSYWAKNEDQRVSLDVILTSGDLNIEQLEDIDFYEFLDFSQSKSISLPSLRIKEFPDPVTQTVVDSLIRGLRQCKHSKGVEKLIAKLFPTVKSDIDTIIIALAISRSIVEKDRKTIIKSYISIMG